MSLLKNNGLTAFIGQRTAKHQAALLDAGVKRSESRGRWPWRGEVSRDAHHGEEYQRHDTAGENSRTLHEMSPL